jgi:hypothetical protein
LKEISYDIESEETHEEYDFLTKFLKFNPKSDSSLLKTLKIFKEYCCSEENKSLIKIEISQFLDVPVIILFNKCDIFEKKMTAGKTIDIVFPNYESGKDYRRSKEFMNAAFGAVNEKLSKNRFVSYFYLNANKADSVNSTVKHIYNSFQSENARLYLEGANIL